MKKLLKFVLFLTVSVLSMPLLTVGLAAETKEKLPEEPDALVSETVLAQRQPQKRYDAETTVTLLCGNEVRQLSLEDYLLGVLAAEMPAGFPEEALKAQAVAARTYTLYKMALYADGEDSLHQGADLCDDPSHCEAFADLTTQAAVMWGDSAQIYSQRLQTAVTETDGMILVYEDEPIAAVFCAAATDRTESAKDIWGSDLPYLVSVESPGGRDCSRYEGTVTVAQTDFAAAVRAQFPEADFSQAPSTWFRDSHRSAAGSVLDVLVGEVRLSGSQVRQLAGLNSANFTVKVQDADLVFSTVGYGHGVGLSQYGARYLALDGQTYDQILSHYYPGTQLRLEG